MSCSVHKHGRHGKEPCESEVSPGIDCFPVKCIPKCGQQDCCVKECPCYSPETLACMKRDAVVGIRSQFVFLSNDYDGATLPAPDGEYGPDKRVDIFLNGTGFFIMGHYIQTAASLVLAPPSMTSIANRYPFIHANPKVVGPNGQIHDELIKASRIFVTVNNVNGNCHSFIYEAEVVLVDGAADIALLKINNCKQWNNYAPYVEKCHPFFKFAPSRAAKPGETIYVFGQYQAPYDNTTSSALIGAAELCKIPGYPIKGTLLDHRYTDESGMFLPETVVTNIPFLGLAVGAPIVNCQGNVIGMATHHGAPYQAFVAGPSQFFFNRIVKAGLKVGCGGRRRECHHRHLEWIEDPTDGYYRYRKGYMGLAMDLFPAGDLDTVANWNQAVGGNPVPPNYVPPPGQRIIRITDNGEFINGPGCLENMGFRVLGVSGIPGVLPSDNSGDSSGDNAYYYVPGGTDDSLYETDIGSSAFHGRVWPGDVITHIGKIPIGAAQKQVGPAIFTWRTVDGDQLSICLRRGGNLMSYEGIPAYDSYDNQMSVNATLHDYPKMLDYNWTALAMFENILTQGWTKPTPTSWSSSGATQHVDPLYPVASTQRFHVSV